jgi:hypothetical protein
MVSLGSVKLQMFNVSIAFNVRFYVRNVIRIKYRLKVGNNDASERCNLVVRFNL